MIKWLVSLLLLLAVSIVHAQDSSNLKNKARSLAKDVYDSYLRVKQLPNDTAFIQRSEQSYRKYAGRVIRQTIIEKVDFSRNVLDTTHRVITTISKLANNLQAGTKQYIIHQFLFMSPGDAVDPFQLADNERLLRQLDFIKDARIQLLPVGEDSVDMIVKVRDVFSLGVKASAYGISDFDATLYDANFLGWAQRLEYTLLYDHGRSPAFGSKILYRKYNIAGSFVNGEISYSNINSGISLGDEYETSADIKLDRPLYTPNAKWAGGLHLNQSKSENRTQKPDSLYRAYAYHLQDVWLGYNFGTRITRTGSRYVPDDRNRRFAALRYFNQKFSEKPDLPFYHYLYTDKQFVLGSFSWYRQNYYRTNYILGFGVTEDVPVGFSRKIILGRTRIDSLKRTYLGWEYNHWMVLKHDHLLSYTLALGTNYNKDGFSDNSLLTAMNWYSPLLQYRKVKVRQYATISYAGINNFTAYDKLYLNNDYGLDRYNTDSAYGTQRLTLGTETMLFTPWKLFGFKIGFFAFAKGAMLSRQTEALTGGKLFSAIGGGFRTRNENLIFGTIEGRLTWYPRTLGQINSFAISFNSNLRLRFDEMQFQAPWFATIR
ncbi:hypothetical protein [Flavihumibacter petaseus]|uniref:Bacterial surface antigen (D15) domain-containing protein n=1 Tax=Flavihumibacter petaseus NBRC 106054 TaxID=1220578 RepID=A0A0E9N1I8_9BACT|nr:hypothetical protein [Flavihumibacter petaseus]GAO43210.1 hypothetical protein FPE01S_02_03140 [Flavihumibacter petaseus NBRC 106054]